MSIIFGWKISILCFILGYGGTSLGFDNLPKYGLAIKGFITCPFGGFIALPLAYYIGYKTRFKNVLAEYLSGTFYGLIDENGTVQNAILWDGDTVNNPYPLPEGWQIKQSDVAGIGWTYADGVFSPPQAPVVQPTE